VNNRERVLKTLRGEKTDRTVFMPLTTRTWFFSVPEYARKFKPKWNELGQYVPDVDWDLEFEEIEWRSKFYENIGVTFCQYTNQHGGNHIQYKENPAAGIKVTKIRNDRDNKFQFIFDTPIGSIEQKSEMFPNATVAIRKNLLQSIKDYKVYKYILENQIVSWPGLNDWAEKALHSIEGRGVIFGTGPVPPIMLWIFTVLGVEGVTFGIADHKKELDELVALAHKINLDYLDLIVKTPFEIIIADAVNGVLAISPKIYDEYFLPYHMDYSRVLKEYGKLYVSHSSGEPVGPILDSIEKTGLDGLYGFRFPPNPSDPEIGTVCRKWAAKKMTVMGGIDPHFLATSTPAKIKEWVKQAMDNVGDCSNFILGTADDTPFGTPVANLAAIPQALDEIYG
jgi:hypothetical protein